jgi:hypothetical protein
MRFHNQTGNQLQLGDFGQSFACPIIHNKTTDMNNVILTAFLAMKTCESNTMQRQAVRPYQHWGVTVC